MPNTLKDKKYLGGRNVVDYCTLAGLEKKTRKLIARDVKVI